MTRGRTAANVPTAVLFGTVSFSDGRRYESAATLWAPEVERSPQCREGQFYLGELARSNERWADAEARYEAALAVTPGDLSYVDRGAALQNLALVELAQGDLGEADRALVQALHVVADPLTRRRLVHDRTVVALRAKDPASAARSSRPGTSTRTSEPRRW